MKEEILKRAMFAMPLSKKAQSSGIMSGFDMEEMEGEEEDLKEMPPMARTPQNPEILMNTLRGDMRSVDARYQELAQMVGEEAAMETPPEVLAMLQGQMGAQQQPQGGIGSLPQGQQMAPPPMGMPPPDAGMPPPDQMGAPQPAPAMPQGGIPMPAGMESAPPFSPGAEAPEGYAYGGIVRGAQMVGDKLGQYGSAANAALGRMFMNPEKIMTQPYLENVRGAGGRFTAEQIQRGGDVSLLAPTFTQGLQQGVARVAEQYPRLASALRVSPMAGMFATLPFVQGSSDTARTAEQEKARQDLINQIPTGGYPPAPPADDPRRAGGPTPAPVVAPALPAVAPPMAAATTEAEQAAIDERQLAAAEKVDTDPLGSFINQKLKLFDEREAKGKPLSKVDRIRKGQAEYGPLFEELLGSDKEAAKINALLLLSEAGLKLASTAKPTFAMALADSFANVPRGFAAIAAQERELGMKTKSASLQQAISDVDAEDRYLQAQKLKILDIDKALMEKAGKANAVKYDYVGAGGVTISNKESNKRLGFGIEENDPVVQEIRTNPILVNSFGSGSPYARDLGKATTVTRQDLKGRTEAQERFNKLSGQISIIDNALSVVQDAYQPGSFFSSVANNLLVPLTPNFILRPDLNQASANSLLNKAFEDLTRGDAEIGGKMSVQGQKWSRESLAQIGGPDKFFKNPEISAKVFQQRKTDYMNELYRVGTELGIFDRNIVVTTPPTGTRNDPFIIPENTQQREQMRDYLQSILSGTSNQQGTIYFRDKKGTVGMPIEKFLNPGERN